MVAGAENEETLAHNVETVYKGAAKVVSAGMGCRCVAGVSRVFTSPEQIASAWHEASEALRSRGAASSFAVGAGRRAPRRGNGRHSGKMCRCGRRISTFPGFSKIFS